MSATQGLLNQVEDAIASGSAARRGKLVRHVTDLFIVSSPQCGKAEIEVSARALLAVRLAPIDNAPPRIIRTLAFDDEIDVAGPVLEQSERLDEDALVENAHRKGQAHLLAIARRRSLTERITDVLVARGDQQVVLSAVENRGAKFSDSGFTILVRRSDGDDRLAAGVGSRPEISPQHLRALLAKASALVRAKLEAEHPHALREVRQAVGEVVERIGAQFHGAAPDDAAARERIEALQRRGQLDDRRLDAIARSGRFEEIAPALALRCELPQDFVEAALRQEPAEMILIIAKAAGLSWLGVRAILAARTAGRPGAAGEIAHLLASYERLKPATAQEIIRFHRARHQAASKRPS